MPDEFTGAVVLLVVVLAVVLAGIIRLTTHWREFSWKRHERALLSRELPALKSGDILLFIAHANGLTNSLFMNDIYTHSGMVVMYDGQPYLSEATIAMPQLGPEPYDPVLLPNSTVLVPLLPRLQYYPGGVFLMPLKQPLSPRQEEILQERARVSFPYPRFHHMLLSTAVSSDQRVRHCMQHVAYLLDEMGMPPERVAARGQTFLRSSGFFHSSRAVSGLEGGEPLKGGNSYGEIVELLIDNEVRR